MREHKTRRRKRRGFTLIEVLLVLAILVILSTMVTLGFQRTLSRSKISAALAQIDLFETPLNMYQMDMLSLPATNDGLDALIQVPSSGYQEKWQGPYLGDDAIPPDPWGQPYHYEMIDAERYRIWSAGPDGQDGTEDDVSSS